MEITCPRCGSPTKELIECEVCKTMGCVKCIIRHNKRWVCEKCRSGVTATTSVDSVFSSMFG